MSYEELKKRVASLKDVEKQEQRSRKQAAAKEAEEVARCAAVPRWGGGCGRIPQKTKCHEYVPQFRSSRSAPDVFLGFVSFLPPIMPSPVPPCHTSQLSYLISDDGDDATDDEAPTLILLLLRGGG